MSDEPTASPSRRRREQRATSEELVTAAIRVIGRSGVAAATTRKIAEEAGVPQGTVHYWFADKNELLQDVAREVLERLAQSVTIAVPPDTTVTVEAVRAALRSAWAVVAADDPGVQLGYYELTALALRNPSMRELARDQYSNYRDVAAGALAPVLRNMEPSRAAAIARFTAVTFDGLVLAWLADPEGTEIAEVLDLLADAIIQARDSEPNASPLLADAAAQRTTT